RSRQAEVGALQYRQGFLAGGRPRRHQSTEAPRASGPVVGRGGETPSPRPPLDWPSEGLNAELMGRPSLSGNAKTLTYYEGQVGLPPEGSPRVLNKSWTLTADIEVPESGAADGMIATQGGIVGGYGLYIREGKPTFV